MIKSRADLRFFEVNMGLFCVSMHFRTSDDQALPRAMSKRGITRCRVLPSKNGWASLYEEEASHQDDVRIQSLVGDLSSELKVPAIAFMVHDSDIACYWLFENGQLLDQFNSCPDYFGDSDDDQDGARGGQPEILARLTRPGVGVDELEAMLSQSSVFAEGVIEQLAEALGIDPERALSDYRDESSGGEYGGDESSDGNDGGDPSPGGAALAALCTRMAGQLTQMFGSGHRNEKIDPRVQALVDAAGKDDVDSIARQLDDGAAIDAEALTQLPGTEAIASLGQFLPNGPPKISMNALLAAISGKHRRAAELLLARGADPNRQNQLYGTALHAAAGAGDAELLRLLLDRGGDLTARNLQQQTPLQVLAAGKANVERLRQAQEMMKAMGIKMPGIADQLSGVKLPVDGWAACEKLLKERGAV